MAYYVTENFAAGIDTRKHPVTAPPGTLRELKNAHLTPGGEIEKRLAFVRAHQCSPAPIYKGMMRVGDILYVLVKSGTLPNDIIYGELTIRYIQVPGTPNVDRVMDWDIFDGRLYITCQSGNTGAPQHFYQTAEGSKLFAHVPDGKGAWIRTYQQKMYSCRDGSIYFSTVGDPTDWTTTANGAGFIDAAVNDAEALDLTGIEVYYDQLAFFSPRAVQLWRMDPDPANNTQVQTLRSIGVAARATPRQYGPGDILFLAPSGIRSLQARDSSNSASVNDVGSSIDRDIVQKLRDNSDFFVNNTQTMLEELTGRFWVMFPDETWVLSLFPAPGVRAWSRYAHSWQNGASQAGFTPETLVDAAGYVCMLGTDNWIYVLGGEGRETYDNCEVDFITPYINLDKPASWKQFIGMDAAVDGTWDWDVSYDPDNVIWEPIGTITKSTYNDQRMGVRGQSPCVSMRGRSTFEGYARVANIAVHYNLSKND